MTVAKFGWEDSPKKTEFDTSSIPRKCKCKTKGYKWVKLNIFKEREQE